MNPNAEQFVKLIEEMIHLKVQQELDANKRPMPEIARVLSEKRISDQRRMEQIKLEMTMLLDPGA